LDYFKNDDSLRLSFFAKDANDIMEMKNNMEVERRTLMKTVRQRQLDFFGHVMRRNEWTSDMGGSSPKNCGGGALPHQLLHH